MRLITFQEWLNLPTEERNYPANNGDLEEFTQMVGRISEYLGLTSNDILLDNSHSIFIPIKYNSDLLLTPQQKKLI